MSASTPLIAELERRVFALPGGVLSMAFRLIPTGSFRMGSRGENSDEVPMHRVRIAEPFWLAETPVTQAEFGVWTAAEGIEHENGFPGYLDHPAENMDWRQASAYCAWLTQIIPAEPNNELPPGYSLFCLPTEAEWEYACRAGTETDYHTGDGEAALADAGWLEGNYGNLTHPVGHKRANAFSLYDLHGNVLEWCHDVYDPQAYRRRVDGVAGPGAEIRKADWLAGLSALNDSTDDRHRVIRGGSWDVYAGGCRSAVRVGWRPDVRDWYLGFRVCLVRGPARKGGAREQQPDLSTDLSHDHFSGAAGRDNFAVSSPGVGPDAPPAPSFAMSTTTPDPRVINCPDQAPDWEAWDDPEQGRQVLKIVLGPSPGDDQDKNKGIAGRLPADFATRFENLTHLYLWRLTDLKVLPALPPKLECLDVRGCGELGSIINLPPTIETLVLQDCTGVRSLPIPAPGVLENLEEVSLKGCVMLEESTINSLLAAVPNVRHFDASGCRNLRRIGITAADGDSLRWPESLVDLRLDDCALLKTIPARWPGRLRRLGLRRAAALAAVPKLPMPADYIDLAHTASLRFVPEFVGRPRTVFLHGSGVRLDPALLGESETTNVARAVLADAAEGGYGREADHEVKVILLGNGRCGKSSLARRWIGEPFDPEEKSTHGVRHWTKFVPFTPLDAGDGANAKARLNIWDFAGQDLYHNTHRLFLQSRAIFVLCWTDHGDGSDERTDLEERAREIDEDVRRSLDYWRAQVAALGNMPGLNRPPPIIVVRTKQDRDGETKENVTTVRAAARPTGEIAFSAKTGDGLAEIEHRIEELTAEMLGVWERRSLPVRAMAVKAQLQVLKDSNDAAFLESERSKHLVLSPHPTMKRTAFDAMVREHCPEGDYHDDPTLLLARLHTNGFLFYDAEHLPDDVVLDQRWAVEGVYAFSARESEWHILKRLGDSGGEFTLSELSRYSWGPAGYTPEQQAMLLRFMLSCGMCFELMQAGEAQRGETVYAAPGFFPTRSSRLRRFPEIVNGPAAPWATRSVPGVSEPEMLALLCWVGTHWRRIAEKWRWGAMFEAADTDARVIMDWQRADPSDYAGTLRVWFDGTADPEFEALVREAVVEALSGPTSDAGGDFKRQWPEPCVERKPRREAVEASLDGSVIPGSPERRSFPTKAQSLGLTITFSFAGSNKANPFTGEIPATLGRRLVKGSKSDKRVKVLLYDLPEGEERLAEFTRNLAEGDLTVVFWSPRYFYSDYCMTEMMLIYQRPPAGRLPEKRILTYMLDGARLSKNGLIKAADWDTYWDVEANKRHEEAVKAASATTVADRLLREKTKHLKRDGIVQSWYEFIADGPAFEEFLAALKGYRIGRSVARPKSNQEVEAAAAKLEAEVSDFLKAPATMIDLASQRLESGRTEDAVRLLLHAIACAPDAGHQGIEAWLQHPGDHAIPDALLAAAKAALTENDSADA